MDRSNDYWVLIDWLPDKSFRLLFTPFNVVTLLWAIRVLPMLFVKNLRLRLLCFSTELKTNVCMQLTNRTDSSSVWQTLTLLLTHLFSENTLCVVSIQALYLLEPPSLSTALMYINVGFDSDTSLSNFRSLTSPWMSAKLKSSQS